MPEPADLLTLMVRKQKLDRAVCLDYNKLLNLGRFRQLVAQWVSVLAVHSGRVYALYTEDTFQFAAALVALWQCHKTALLPGDCLPATMKGIAPEVDGFIGDFPSERKPLQFGEPGGSTLQFSKLDPQLIAVIVFTSGSTGLPSSVSFKLSQLDTELRMHEQLWGTEVGNSLISGTVSNQHLYGLLFRVLWPLVSGRPFTRRLAHHLEGVVESSEHWSPIVVITTPSHLSRLPVTIDWQSFRSRCSGVFSSTAPLSHSDSLAAEEYFGVSITEIFGSSETGGIAWRRQGLSDRWHTLPGIRVRQHSADGALQILSPILENTRWLTTADCIEYIDEDHFRLLGRLDNIAKIEGKRVSLNAMETQLCSHPWISKAKLTVLQNFRTEIGAAATLTEPGKQQLREMGKRHLVASLRNVLGNQFERPVIPRRWRFVDRLPSNTQGKISQPALQALFTHAHDADPQTPRQLPQVLSRHNIGDHCVELQLLISAEIAFFEGHFPSAPILPGVVQIHWAEHYSRQCFAAQLPDRRMFAQLEAVKFQRVIQPGRELTLQLVLKTNGKLLFRYSAGTEQFSSGRLVYHSTDSNLT